MAILGWMERAETRRSREEWQTQGIAARSQRDEMGGDGRVILLRWPFGERELRKAARPDVRDG